MTNDGHSTNTDRIKVNGLVARGSRHEDQLMGYPSIKEPSVEKLRTRLEEDWKVTKESKYFHSSNTYITQGKLVKKITVRVYHKTEIAKTMLKSFCFKDN